MERRSSSGDCHLEGHQRASEVKRWINAVNLSTNLSSDRWLQDLQDLQGLQGLLLKHAVSP